MMTPFVEGGWPTYVVLLCSLVTHPLAIGAVAVAFGSKRRAMAIGLSSAALLFALSTVAIGVGGYLYVMHVVDGAVAFADPSTREIIRAQGEHEASWNATCGVLGCAIPLLLALAGLVRGFTLTEPSRATP